MKQKVSRRRLARRAVVEHVYADLLGGALQGIQENMDTPFFEELLQAVRKNRSELENLMAGHLQGRGIDELTYIEHAVLLLGVYELKYKLEVPKRVVINEAIDLAKEYGAQDSYKFINGVLDALAGDWRQLEV